MCKERPFSGSAGPAPPISYRIDVGAQKPPATRVRENLQKQTGRRIIIALTTCSPINQCYPTTKAGIGFPKPVAIRFDQSSQHLEGLFRNATGREKKRSRLCRNRTGFKVSWQFIVNVGRLYDPAPKQ
jgi:hypothetical protein